jgi:type VI secretion system protein ImpK
MRLIDCFMPLIVYVVQIVKGSRETRPDFETVKSEIDRLLALSLKLKEKTHFSDQDYKYAQLSICVWIDEAILNSDWDQKRLWQKELLQRRYYNITDGGLEFFERLDCIGHEDRDVREVAYYCLVLGLAGRYVEKGDKVVLDHLKTTNLKRLYGSSAGEPTLENRQLFPEAYQKQAFEPPPKARAWSWNALPLVMGLLPIGLFIGLMIAYHFLLKADLSKFSPM